jgi:eukaryotic-like serine/threonine-protein kinase
VVPVFDDRYEVLAKIGQGGMADVYLVRQHGAMGFRRLAVVKKVRRAFLTDDRVLRLFLEEARLAARIDHPHVIRIHDLGRADDTYFMVMDYVHGRSVVEALRVLRRRGETVPAVIAASITADVCAGLASAHRPDTTGRILVHRDVTPNNILVGFDGIVRLVDFGLAGYHHFRKDARRRRALLGNVPFIAPEVFLGREAVPQTDLWGVGLTLYAMLVGANPFHRESAEKTAYAVVNERLAREWRRIPRRLFAVIKRALAKNPAERYANAADMELDLRRAVARLGGRSCGGTSTGIGVGEWLRSLFGQQIDLEEGFARLQETASLTDALLCAAPAEVERLYVLLQHGASVYAAGDEHCSASPSSDTASGTDSGGLAGATSRPSSSAASGTSSRPPGRGAASSRVAGTSCGAASSPISGASSAAASDPISGASCGAASSQASRPISRTASSSGTGTCQGRTAGLGSGSGLDSGSPSDPPPPLPAQLIKAEPIAG